MKYLALIATFMLSANPSLAQETDLQSETATTTQTPAARAPCDVNRSANCISGIEFGATTGNGGLNGDIIINRFDLDQIQKVPAQ